MPLPRDALIDGLRCASLLRVALLHLVQRTDLALVVPLSFAAPSMALVFFVSGALAARSLGANGVAERAALRRDRARRLLLPFWGYALVVGGGALALELASAHPWLAVPRAKLAGWALPLVVPPVSPALGRLVWHLWFLAVFLVMLGTAPWTLALHRRAPWAGAAAFGAGALAVDALALDLPETVVHVLAFGAAFQLGYGYDDGRWGRARPRALAAAAVALAAASVAWHAARAPGRMLHEVELAHLGLGLALVLACLAVRAPATRLAELEPCRRFVAAFNPRAYSVYLWGPFANEVAWRALEPWPSARLPLYFPLAIALLAAIVRVVGPLEDFAAGRRRAARATPARAA